MSGTEAAYVGPLCDNADRARLGQDRGTESDLKSDCTLLRVHCTLLLVPGAICTALREHAGAGPDGSDPVDRAHVPQAEPL
eukprot:371788-Rhodomonas_salina.3